MKKNYIFITLFFAFTVSYTQTVLLYEGFDNAAQYTLNVTEVIESPTAYFTRTDGTNITNNLSIDPGEGNYFTAQDIDTGSMSSPATMLFSGISIAGKSDITFGISIAESDALNSSEDWDNDDYLHIEYQIDGGSWTNLIWIESNGSGESAPQIDTDFDGNGDGDIVTNYFDESIEKSIPNIGGTGSLINIRLTFGGLTDPEEDIAIKELYLADGLSMFPTATITDPTDGINLYSGTSSVDVIFSTTNSANISHIDALVNDVLTSNISSPFNVPTSSGTGYTIEVLVYLNGFATIPVFIDEVFFNVAAKPLNMSINEIHANPAGDISGDANGDGVRDSADDEFVEIYNADASSIDISGYTISDASGIKHTFPASTVIPGNSFITVFGGGTPTGISGMTQTASSGSLSLNNTGDSVIIRNTTGDLVKSYTYSNSSNQSACREPDFTGSFIGHLSHTSNPVRFSPGARNDDTSLSISNNSIENLKLHPNPTDLGYVNISSSMGSKMNITIFNILGNQILNTTINNSILDISTLSAGVYLLKISQSNTTAIKKLIIK